jgi:hypothetical protein
MVFPTEMTPTSLHHPDGNAIAVVKYSPVADTEASPHPFRISRQAFQSRFSYIFPII